MFQLVWMLVEIRRVALNSILWELIYSFAEQWGIAPAANRKEAKQAIEEPIIVHTARTSSQHFTMFHRTMDGIMEDIMDGHITTLAMLYPTTTITTTEMLITAGIIIQVSTIMALILDIITAVTMEDTIVNHRIITIPVIRRLLTLVGVAMTPVDVRMQVEDTTDDCL